MDAICFSLPDRSFSLGLAYDHSRCGDANEDTVKKKECFTWMDPPYEPLPFIQDLWDVGYPKLISGQGDGFDKHCPTLRIKDELLKTVLCNNKQHYICESECKSK